MSLRKPTIDLALDDEVEDGEDQFDPSRRDFFKIGKRQCLSVCAWLLAACSQGRRATLMGLQTKVGPLSKLEQVVKSQAIDDLERRFGSVDGFYLAKEIVQKFFDDRQERIAAFCGSKSAIRKYKETLSPELLQIYVANRVYAVPGQKPGKNVAVINRAAQDFLWQDDHFPELRYRKGHYIHPQTPELVRAWGKRRPHAILLYTESQINGHTDLVTLMLIRQEEDWEHAPFRLYRLWQFCHKDSHAAELIFGHSFAGRKIGEETFDRARLEKDLPNINEAGVERRSVINLVDIRKTLVQGHGDPGCRFRYGQRRPYVADRPLHNELIARNLDHFNPKALAHWIDRQLLQDEVFADLL